MNYVILPNSPDVAKVEQCYAVLTEAINKINALGGILSVAHSHVLKNEILHPEDFSIRVGKLRHAESAQIHRQMREGMKASDIRKIEKRIVRAVVREILKAGNKISVHDSEEFALVQATSMKSIMESLFATSEDTLIVWSPTDKRIGWIQFVYNNSGWDVIADHTMSIEPYLTLANKIIDKVAV